MNTNVYKTLNTIKNSINKCFNQQQQLRHYCYKVIKRPTLSTVGGNNTTTTTEDCSTINNKTKKSPGTENASQKLSLSEQLKLRIDTTGPITVAEYMKQILTNTNSGYYMHRDVFGSKGDFITSPEIGQIFGELIAIWIITEWRKIGSPLPLQLVEFGPGRGTLTQDILRVFNRFNIINGINVNLIELSPYLSNIQGKRLCHEFNEQDPQDPANHFKYQFGKTSSGIPISWYRNIADMPNDCFSIYLAHEFFDALPIHKFQLCTDTKQKKNNSKQWREILIDYNTTNTTNTNNNQGDMSVEKNNSEFRFVLSKSETPALKLFQMNMNELVMDKITRDHIEYSIESDTILELLADRIESAGGFGLIMDYGHFGDKTDTFRAFKNHKLFNPLNEPGTADVTADVDFKQLKYVCEKHQKLITFGPIEQRDFLLKLGGDTRLDMLLKNAKTKEVKDSLESGYDMLINPTKMGSRFKFFSIFPSVLNEHLQKFPVNGFR